MITIQLNQREVLHLWTTLEASEQYFSRILRGKPSLEAMQTLNHEAREHLDSANPDWRALEEEAEEELAPVADLMATLKSAPAPEVAETFELATGVVQDLLAQLGDGTTVQISPGAADILTGLATGAFHEAELVRKHGMQLFHEYAAGIKETTGVNPFETYEAHWGDDPVQFFTERHQAFYSITQKIEIAYEQELRETEDWRPCGPDCGCELLRDADHEPAGRGAADPAGDSPRIGAERFADRAAGG